MRVSLTSDFATTSLKTATDEFMLTLQDGCFNNKLVMDASLVNSSGGTMIPDQTYKVTVPGAPTPSLVLTPLYSSTISPASCPLSATLFIWDDATNSWKDSSALTAAPFVAFVQTDTGAPHTAGRVTIQQDSLSFIPEKIYKVKIRITDPASSNPSLNTIEH